ncbi:GATA transcription factor 27-like [Silene latifolia]|uniref:GATA transcription factor 27-like n=1 Tax=Silene latifolia TaxID=37657 RepID=UPI003D7721E1
MGKKGPCCHCGVASTPLWRNGPPDKPVLCNACGSRWRTKGSLVNYTPLHSRVDRDDYEDHRDMKMKSISLKKKDEKLNKRKLNFENRLPMDREFTPNYNQGYLKSIDEDTSNRSSSGSAISNESCAQFSSADASELTGPAQSIVRDALIPSWKRTCLSRPKQSSVRKLTKDLYAILNEQGSQFSASSEEDLLYESEAPMVSVEIGHGSVLIRHPSSMARDEESEASSLSVENKLCRADESYSNAASLSVNNSFSRVKEVRKLNGQVMQVEHLKRDKYNHEQFLVLCNQLSTLSNTDLTGIVNFNVFRGYLTDAEQQDLLKYLPSVDSCAGFDSLESVFTSTHFKENLSSFQQLLEDGMLDTSFPGVQTEDLKVLKRLALSNLSKCKWLEHYNNLKNKVAEDCTEQRINKFGAKSCFAGTLTSESKYTMKSPKRVPLKVDYKRKGSIQNDMSYFTPTSRNIFALPNDGSSLMFDSMHHEDEYSDQDLLLDIPSNGFSPEAELLCPSSGFTSHQPSASSSSIHPSNMHT